MSRRLQFSVPTVTFYFATTVKCREKRLEDGLKVFNNMHFLTN